MEILYRATLGILLSLLALLRRFTAKISQSDILTRSSSSSYKTHLRQEGDLHAAAHACRHGARGVKGHGDEVGNVR